MRLFPAYRRPFFDKEGFNYRGRLVFYWLLAIAVPILLALWAWGDGPKGTVWSWLALGFVWIAAVVVGICYLRLPVRRDSN